MPDGFNALKKRILEEYEQAYKEISAKAQDFADKSKVRELEMRAKLKDGKITQAQFDSWMKGQVFQGAQWEDRKKQMAATLRHADEVAAQMANGERFRQFAYGHNRIAYEITKDAGVMINFTQYDADTVRRLIKDRPDLLPPRKLAGRDKAYSYYNRMMDRIATQGILQGESVQKIAQRIAKQTGESAAGAALRNARTMQTGAQNAGRLEGMHRAQDMGIKLKKMWIATLDGRTRDSHRDLDGQTQDIDKPFDSPLGDIMFPGDPDAKPGNVWNCRCTLGNSYPEYPYSILKRRDNETKQIVENMTYRDWEKATGRAKDKQVEKKDNTQYQGYKGDQYDEEYQRLKERFAQAQKEQYEAYNNLRMAHVRGQDVDALRAEFNKKVAELDDISKALNKYSIEATMKATQNRGVEYVPLNKHDKPLADNEIIARLAGGDQTQGSCASLAYCYVGQKAGYDVLDFRDGNSREMFASNCREIQRSLLANGFDGIRGVAKNFKTAGKRALEQAVEGKEYYFECGRHAAIVRRTGKEAYEYLELQASRENGWHPFSKKEMDSLLNWRFGANIGGMGTVSSTLVSVDDMAQSERVLKMLGYINTEESKQHKGASGHER